MHNDIWYGLEMTLLHVVILTILIISSNRVLISLMFIVISLR